MITPLLGAAELDFLHGPSVLGIVDEAVADARQGGDLEAPGTQLAFIGLWRKQDDVHHAGHMRKLMGRRISLVPRGERWTAEE